ncbi:MAG: 2-hydroxychromene-2-carboxylate isomerase [Alphaproteobacteria bacterium]|nr:2-hydroxychromene-2-carboxylate isomerase [Alphaproteobacteria bacterium]
MRLPQVQFWYEFASPYSYIAAHRVERLFEASGAEIVWRPLMLGPIFAANAVDGSPYQQASPAERRYRQRDVERLCAVQNLPLNWPSTYPRNGLLAARTALIGCDAGWVADFSKAVYRANFVEDEEINEAPVIAAVLSTLGLDADAVLDAAQAPDNKARLKAQIEEAQAHGVFGAPTVQLPDGELFWGNDRLDEAVRWMQDGAWV